MEICAQTEQELLDEARMNGLAVLEIEWKHGCKLQRALDKKGVILREGESTFNEWVIKSPDGYTMRLFVFNDNGEHYTFAKLWNAANVYCGRSKNNYNKITAEHTFPDDNDIHVFVVENPLPGESLPRH